VAWSGPALAQGDGVITSPYAVGCWAHSYLTDIARTPAKLSDYLKSGECVRIAGWYYKVVGEMGQYGDYTFVLAGPDREGYWEGWYTRNEWVR
jgi:hypothetical protein